MTAQQIFVDAKIRYACAAEIGHANEKLVFTNYDVIGGFVHFEVCGVPFYAKLTKAGRAIKKGSVRKDRT